VSFGVRVPLAPTPPAREGRGGLRRAKEGRPASHPPVLISHCLKSECSVRSKQALSGQTRPDQTRPSRRLSPRGGGPRSLTFLSQPRDKGTEGGVGVYGGEGNKTPPRRRPPLAPTAAPFEKHGFRKYSKISWIVLLVVLVSSIGSVDPRYSPDRDEDQLTLQCLLWRDDQLASSATPVCFYSGCESSTPRTEEEELPSTRPSLLPRVVAAIMPRWLYRGDF
jgi:hypothetical protein